ncbi:helix-turn-helix domain-containing protein [Flavobacterium sp.]|uniref:helix-turn-helix domain-containing protein n=1 Tax=Flavobacterium sp. TaxID=239 RepID=UPI0037503797
MIFLINVEFYIVNNVKDLEYIKRFGINLKQVRTSKKISQEVLAYSADIPISQVGRIERGEINTTISSVKAIAIALNIQIKELFEFE